MFGTRIHGNLIALLAGKPAVVYLPSNADLRVYELAEFFGVPMVRKLKRNLADIYAEADYTKFNIRHKENFDRFDQFLIENNICDGLPKGKNKELETVVDKLQPETLDYEQLNKEMRKMSWITKEVHNLKECIF